MPVRLVTADDWRPSSMTERRLLELEREGLLRPRTSSSRPEWIAPAACNTLGVCHLLSTRFELKHDKFNGNKEVKVNL